MHFYKIISALYLPIRLHMPPGFKAIATLMQSRNSRPLRSFLASKLTTPQPYSNAVLDLLNQVETFIQSAPPSFEQRLQKLHVATLILETITDHFSKYEMSLPFFNSLPSLSKWHLLSSHAVRANMMAFFGKHQGLRFKPVVMSVNGDVCVDNAYFLGKGKYGKVKSGTLVSSKPLVAKTLVAIKRLALDDYYYFCFYDSAIFFSHEALLHSFFSGHPHIAPFLGAYLYFDGKHAINPRTSRRPWATQQTQPKIGIMTAYADPDLNTVKARSLLPLSQRFFHLKDGVSGLVHMYKLGFAHNDFKLDNLLWMPSLVGTHTGQLTDFGLSIPLDPDLFSVCPPYCLGGNYPPPECLYARSEPSLNRTIDRSKIDVFAVGVALFDILYESINLRVPWYNINHHNHTRSPDNPVEIYLKAVYLFSDKITDSSDYSDEVKDMVRLSALCLSYDPKDRPSILEVF